MNAQTADAPSTEAWYVYGLLPAGGGAPDSEAILPDSRVQALGMGRFTAVASCVRRALFDRADPAHRTSEPDWMSARVRAHHAVNAAAAAAGPFLPLAFGTLFSSLDPLRDWLAPREAALQAAMTRVADRAEWSLSMQVDFAAQSAWLDRHDSGLLDLAATMSASGEGAAFLHARRLDRARGAARAAHLAAAAEAVASMLRQAALDHPDLDVIDETPGSGPPTPTGPSWSVLAPRTADGASPLWGRTFAPLAAELAPAGLSLRLTGPWPAYAFARAALAPAALAEEHAHG